MSNKHWHGKQVAAVERSTAPLLMVENVSHETPKSVLASAYNPLGDSNHNTDLVQVVAPPTKPITFQNFYGHEQIHEGAGESRPMFTHSVREN